MSCSHHWVDTRHLPEHFRTERYVHYCPVCGWWMVREDAHGRDAAGAYAFPTFTVRLEASKSSLSWMRRTRSMTSVSIWPYDMKVVSEGS